MALTSAFEMVDNQDIYFGDAVNIPMHSRQDGASVISGCAVTANASSDLTNAGQDDIDIASGSVFVNGSQVTVASDSIDLSVEYLALTPGQARYIYVYADSSGNILTVDGTRAIDGSHYPPEYSSVPVNSVLLYRVELTEGKTSVDSNDLKNIRVFSSGGIHFPDNKKVSWGDIGDLIMYHDGTDSFIKNITGKLELWGVSNIQMIDDLDGSDAVLFDFDLNTRTLDIGVSTDNVQTFNHGTINIVRDNVSMLLFDRTDNSSVDTIMEMGVSFDGIGDEYWWAGIASIRALKVYPSGVIKNTFDDAGFYTGFDDDLRMYHDGSKSWIINETSVLSIKSLGGLDFLGNADFNDYNISNFGIRVIDWGAETPGNVSISAVGTANGTPTTARDVGPMGTVKYIGDSCTLYISHAGHAGLGTDGTANGYLQYWDGSAWATFDSVSLSFGTGATSNSKVVTAIINSAGIDGQYRLSLTVNSGDPSVNITVTISAGSPDIEGWHYSV